VCLAQGHIWGDSHQLPGFETCRRCLQRRRAPRVFRALTTGEETAPLAQSGHQRGHLRTITVAARKGGSGKSTIALHLAIAAHLRGHKVLLADIDSQRSATESLSGREDDWVPCTPATGAGLGALHAAAAGAGVKYLIIDTPGGPGPDLTHAMTISDFNLLVARPSFLDIAAAARTVQEARALDRPALILLNQAPPARGGEESVTVTKALEALRYTRLPVSPVIMHARAAFQKAVAIGRSAEELGRSPAADEAAALWTHIEAVLAAPAFAATADAAPARPSPFGAPQAAPG
jgi:chromosome partitioning protein